MVYELHYIRMTPSRFYPNHKRLTTYADNEDAAELKVQRILNNRFYRLEKINQVNI